MKYEILIQILVIFKVLYEIEIRICDIIIHFNESKILNEMKKYESKNEIS